MMRDLNGALNAMHSHLNAFNAATMQETLATLQKDNEMLKGMQNHTLDAEGKELASKIQSQVQNLQQSLSKPSVGVQQMVVSKWHKELKETRERIKDILKRTPSPNRSIEKNYKPKT